MADCLAENAVVATIKTDLAMEDSPHNQSPIGRPGSGELQLSGVLKDIEAAACRRFDCSERIPSWCGLIWMGHALVDLMAVVVRRHSAVAPAGIHNPVLHLPPAARRALWCGCARGGSGAHLGIARV